MSFVYRNRRVIFILVLVFILLVSSVGYFYLNNNSKSNKKISKNVLLTDNSKSLKKISKSKNIDNAIYYKVDIKGEIKNPGIYSLKSGSRVDDVIKEAGGLLDSADTTVINLSKKIKDEMVIIVYSKSQVADFRKTRESENKVIESCINTVVDGSIRNDACVDSNNDSQLKITSKVSINTADVEEFMTLSGIGESKAQKIIKYRDENGPFKSVEDLKNVDGIGDSIYDKIKENITL